MSSTILSMPLASVCHYGLFGSCSFLMTSNSHRNFQQLLKKNYVTQKFQRTKTAVRKLWDMIKVSTSILRKISNFLGNLPSEQMFYRNVPLGAPVLLIGQYSAGRLCSVVQLAKIEIYWRPCLINKFLTLSCRPRFSPFYLRLDRGLGQS